MRDPRVDRYAELLVGDCLGVEPGWQVLVASTPLARPLVEAVSRAVAARGAYALQRLSFADEGDLAWQAAAPDELLAELAPIERQTFAEADALCAISAPENTRDGSALSPERRATHRRALAPVVERLASERLRWVGCQYPTEALAQEAGMTLRQFDEFLFGAVLVDWDALRGELERIAARFDAAEEVRLVAPGTDVAFSLAGRSGRVDVLGANVPGGEVFYSPVEDSVRGAVAFEYPSVYGGVEVADVRLRFEDGRVVEATAGAGEEHLRVVLDTDEGARVLGEFGIGGNPGIRRYTKNTLFDEKMAGTVHLALGAGFPFLGGTNVSAVHWDLVKDLRAGGELLCDGEVVQRDGEWLL